MANATLKPAKDAILFIRGSGWSQKFVPKNNDDTVFDCTDYSASGGLAAPFLPTASPRDVTPKTQALTFTANDATGITFSLTAAQVEFIYQASCGLPGTISGWAQNSDSVNAVIFSSVYTFQTAPGTNG
jgi:hypothetical protein